MRKHILCKMMLSALAAVTVCAFVTKRTPASALSADEHTAVVEPAAEPAVGFKSGDSVPAAAEPGETEAPAAAKPGELPAPAVEPVLPAVTDPGETEAPAAAKPDVTEAPAAAEPGETEAPAAVKPGELPAPAVEPVLPAGTEPGETKAPAAPKPGETNKPAVTQSKTAKPAGTAPPVETAAPAVKQTDPADKTPAAAAPAPAVRSQAPASAAQPEPQRTPANAAQPTTGVTASPAAVRITSFVLDPATSVLRTNETVKFTAAATGDTAIKRYMFYGIRPNGTRFQIYEGANNTAEWVFTSLGQFTFYVKAYDEKGNAAQTSLRRTFVEGGPNVRFNIADGSPVVIRKEAALQATAEGPQGPYQYQFYLVRSSGVVVPMNNRGNSISWTFSTPDTYRFRAIVTDSRGQSIRSEKAFEVHAVDPGIKPPQNLRIQLSVGNGSAIVVREAAPFRASASGTESPYQYDFYLVRANGSVVPMYNQGNSIDWIFSTPGAYRFRAIVTDGNGGVRQTEQPFRVYARNPNPQPPAVLRVQLIVGDGSTIRAEQATIFRANASGTKSPYQYKFYLVRSNGGVVPMNNRGNSISWTFSTPDTYKFRAVVTDAAGKTARSEKAFRVYAVLGPDSNAPRIFLSPSNQPENPYWNGSTNEREQMEAVAQLVYERLKPYNAHVYLPDYEEEERKGWRTPGWGTINAIRKTGRPTTAKNLKADFYLAIHSNATGNGTVASGPLALYHPQSQISQNVAQSLYQQMMKVTPFPDTAGGVRDGMKAFGGDGYGEIRSPYEFGIPAVLFEVNFHDNPATGAWIIANKQTIADAIVKGLVESLSLKKRSADDQPDQPPAPEPNLPAPDPPAIEEILILGRATATQAQARAWAVRNNAAQWFIDQLPTYWKVSLAAGVDPAVTYAQSALETGFGRFGGVINATYFNPCGMKTTAGGGDYVPAAHAKFKNWLTGITAQVDHLALYAGAANYPKIQGKSNQQARIVLETGCTPDPRHFDWLHGTARTVKALGAKWAPSSTYGERVIGLIQAIRRS